MKILLAHQVRELDAYTIQHEPIASIDLMERAALAFVKWFQQRFPDTDRPVHIFCGPGNNGGDGLAVARLLHQRLYPITVWICDANTEQTPDFQINMQRLPQKSDLQICTIKPDEVLPTLPAQALLIDAIFGAGLNRPLSGFWARLITHLNEQALTRIAIDIPTGLFADQHTTGVSLHAHYTFSFEMPKLAFFFPENQHIVGEWHYESIGLHPNFIAKVDTPYYYIDITIAKQLHHQRQKFNHKGNFGHALLIMGSYGKMGAAILAARACLRSGVGLATIHAPKCAYPILQMSVPEAMVSIDRHEFYLSEIPSLKPYRSIGAGCGLDQKKTSCEALALLLEQSALPIVLDADALNMISKEQKLLDKLPQGSLLTPHVREFERLFGKSTNDFERHELQRQQAQELGVYIILKGAHTCIATPEGNCYFNATGNPGMATGGSGDVLTGILTGLLAQQYSPLEAALLGVYLHGLAGDLAAATIGQDALIASDLIEYLGKAYLALQA